MNKLTDYKKSLIKQYHTLCTINGLNKDDRDSILSGFGVESSLELTEVQLSFTIEKLQKDGNTWRKRVIAAIGGWLRATGKTENINLIKSIACRCAQNEDFNKIPVSRLRDIYYEFTNKAKTIDNISEVMADELKNSIYQN